MARENIATLYGQIISQPQVFITEEGVKTRAGFAMKVIRRIQASNGLNETARIILDTPIVKTRNERLIEKIVELRTGDMVYVKGVFSTEDVIKKRQCPCGNIVQSEGNAVYITPIYIEKRESELSREDGFALLKECNEISNSVLVMGKVLYEPQYKEDDSGTFAQYHMKVKRRIRIKEDPADKKYDYPWVKSYRGQAIEDAKSIHEDSIIYINGAIQTRSVRRKETCEKCGEAFDWSESVAEIVPYSTEYLVGCDFPEDEEEDDDTVIVRTNHGYPEIVENKNDDDVNGVC